MAPWGPARTESPHTSHTIVIPSSADWSLSSEWSREKGGFGVAARAATGLRSDQEQHAATSFSRGKSSAHQRDHQV